MKKQLFIFLIITLVTNFTFAQKFTASASKNRIGIGEQIQISFSLNTNGSNFKAPSLKDFDVYSGPNQSTSMQFINGSMSQSISFSYIIAAKKEGKYTIQPASITINGNKVESNSIIIEVVKGGSSGSTSAGGNSQQNTNGAKNGGDDIFARSIVNKTKVYQGEQITLTHKIYSRLNLRGFQDVQFPSYTGFWAQDLPSQNQQINLTTENIDGTNYYVAEIKKTFLFPQQSGTIEISPIEIECVVRERSNSAPQSIFDQFFGNGGYRDAVYKVKSRPVKVEVLPLPEEGKPQNFSGAVGSFSFKAELTKDKIKANDAVNLKMNISGRGNLKLIDFPKLTIPAEIESYDPKTNESIAINSNGVSGSKSFDWLLIPRQEGIYQLGEIAFSYFDPEKKKYVLLPSPDFKIDVEKSDEKNSSPTTISNSVTKEEVEVLTNDIRYIKTNKIELKEKEKYFFGSWIFLTLTTLPILLAITGLSIRTKFAKENSNLVLLKSKSANKVANKRLTTAKKHIESNNKEAFYDELFRALYGYLSDKLSIPVAELSRDSINSSLKNRNVPTETIEALLKTLDNCEYARYAANAANDDLNSIYNTSAEIITKIENTTTV